MAGYRGKLTGAQIDALPDRIRELEAENASLRAQLQEVRGDDGTETAVTPQIDSQKEMTSFLEGYDNTKKLKDVIGGKYNEEDESLDF